MISIFNIIKWKLDSNKANNEIDNIQETTVVEEKNVTNINYPFVKASDNKYYLTNSFDKSYNSAGWIF